VKKPITYWQVDVIASKVSGDEKTKNYDSSYIPPSGYWSISIAVLGIGLLVFVFMLRLDDTLFGIITYPITLYAMIVLAIGVPDIIKTSKTLISKNKYGRRYIKEIITMSEIRVNSKNFIGYEYKEIAASRNLEGVYADGYPNFGWELDGGNYGRLKFKRNRKIRNKVELSRLQREFESKIREVENLERSKTSGAQVTALTVGLIGTVLLGGATFAYIYGHMIP
jgi:hypothetical protein